MVPFVYLPTQFQKETHCSSKSRGISEFFHSMWILKMFGETIFVLYLTETQMTQVLSEGIEIIEITSQM
jgi:hypothetical protein